MNQHLKQAIAAARAGKEPQAKVLLARVIKDEPENVNAWFLLSSLADTEEQKVQHLEKVLELQPDHAVASQQLAELVPPSPAAVEEAILDTFEDDSHSTIDIEDPPDDPDEAMAWLEELAADQGAPIDELPSLANDLDTADTVLDLPDLDDIEAEDTAPEDPDEAMAWLEQLAADQGAPMDELPTLIDEEDGDKTEIETFPWLDEADDDIDYQELPTLIDEAVEEDDTAEPAKTLAVSDESTDFVSQAEGDSIPSWLVGDEDFISADTVITGPAEEVVEEKEPENLPDWLNEMPADSWEGEEGKKSGQVVWKPGEGDDSLKPTPPTAKEKSKPAAKQTAESKGDNNFLLALLVIFAIILVFAILYLLITQPL